jgi:acyl carrier protein
VGLDSVEIVMELEERFGINLPDHELHTARTVADLAALVIARLPKTGSPVCPTACSFYRLRRALMAVTGADRDSVRPSVGMDQFLPRRPFRRRMWAGLRAVHPGLPRLVAPRLVDRFLIWMSLFALAALPVGAIVLVGLYGIAAGLLSVAVAVACALAALALLARVSAQSLPESLTTVGDVARAAAPRFAGLASAGPGERLVLEMDILSTVRQVVAEQLGLPLEAVEPASDLVNDLSID